jgi:hypothetical protein
MSKTDKKSDAKSGTVKKISKLKKAMKKLKLFEKELKAKEKKIDGKLKNTRCKSCKKDKPKDKKDNLADLTKKAKKDAKKKKEKKDALKKEKEKKSKKHKTSKPKAQTKPFRNALIAQEPESEPEKEKSEQVEVKNVSPVSEDFNARDAIAFVRKLEGIYEIDAFIKNEGRITVSKAAEARKHVIER